LQAYVTGPRLQGCFWFNLADKGERAMSAACICPYLTLTVKLVSAWPREPV
jgi:hypothetical protein